MEEKVVILIMIIISTEERLEKADSISGSGVRNIV